MTTVLTIAALMLVMVSAPDIPLSRFLRRAAIETPARWCARITRGHLYLILLLALVVSGVAWVMEGDGLRLLGMASPDLVAWIALFDIATYLDVAVTAILLAGTVRVHAVRRWLFGHLRPRARRTRVNRLTRKAANDDEDRRSLAA